MYRLWLLLILLPLTDVSAKETLLSLDEYEARSAEAAILRHRAHAERVRQATAENSDESGRIDAFLDRLDLEERHVEDLRTGNPPVVAIARGQPTARFPSVGALIYNLETVCSGTLVGPQSFLTARHCFEPSQDPSDYAIYLQHAGIFTVEDLQFPENTDLDLAILKLHEKVTGVQPTELPEELSTAKRFLRIVGFGVTSDGGMNSGIKRYGGNTTTTCPEGDDQFICWELQPPYEPIGMKSNPCSRDSGGPVGPGSEENLAVVEGVAVRVPLKYKCDVSSLSWSLAVFPQIEWLKKVVTPGELGALSNLPVCCGDGAKVLAKENKLPRAGLRRDDYPFTVPGSVGVLRVALNADDVSLSDLDLSIRSAAVSSNLAAWSDDAPSCKTLGRYEACEFKFAGTPPVHWAVSVQHKSGGDTFYQLVVTMFERP
jgi:hypothetical protein